MQGIATDRGNPGKFMGLSKDAFGEVSLVEPIDFATDFRIRHHSTLNCSRTMSGVLVG